MVPTKVPPLVDPLVATMEFLMELRLVYRSGWLLAAVMVNQLDDLMVGRKAVSMVKLKDDH